MLTELQLRQMMPNAGARLDAHLPYINPALEEGRIDTPKRIAAFMAQLAHESGEYRYMEEIWGPTEQQLGYEGRSDLGNVHPGDGPKFKGHGPIQITGRNNHADCGEALGLDLIADPLLITTPEHGTRSAVWFWNSRQLSPLADRDWFKTITRRINGGLNGFSDRRQYWDRNRTLLGLPLVDTGQEGADIIAFQRSRGLVADGDVGPKTMAALAGGILMPWGLALKVGPWLALALAGLVIWGLWEANAAKGVQLAAANAVIAQREADAKANAIAVAQLAQKLNDTETKVITVTEKIYAAPVTRECAASPAMRAATDGVRAIISGGQAGDSAKPAAAVR